MQIPYRFANALPYIPSRRSRLWQRAILGSSNHSAWRWYDPFRRRAPGKSCSLIYNLGVCGFRSIAVRNFQPATQTCLYEKSWFLCRPALLPEPNNTAQALDAAAADADANAGSGNVGDPVSLMPLRLVNFLFFAFVEPVFAAKRRLCFEIECRRFLYVECGFGRSVQRWFLRPIKQCVLFAVQHQFVILVSRTSSSSSTSSLSSGSSSSGLLPAVRPPALVRRPPVPVPRPARHCWFADYDKQINQPSYAHYFRKYKSDGRPNTHLCPPSLRVRSMCR